MMKFGCDMLRYPSWHLQNDIAGSTWVQTVWLVCLLHSVSVRQGWPSMVVVRDPPAAGAGTHCPPPLSCGVPAQAATTLESVQQPILSCYTHTTCPTSTSRLAQLQPAILIISYHKYSQPTAFLKTRRAQHPLSPLLKIYLWAVSLNSLD